MQTQQNRLDKRFSEILQAGNKILIPYITACYPSEEATTAILRKFDQLGVPTVEIGFPFSDPVADGPVIQTSFTRALEKGFHIRQAFDLVRAIAPRSRCPSSRWFPIA